MGDWPVNIFSGGRLDRGGDQRQDPEWIAEQAADPSAFAFVITDGRVLIDEGPDGSHLRRMTPGDADQLASEPPIYIGRSDGGPVFAFEADLISDPSVLLGEAGMAGLPDMRTAAGLLPEQEAAWAGAAKSIFDWRRRHKFCAACGHPTVSSAGGWKRICESCRTEHFPRVDPVVIMLPIHRGPEGERCLLGRQASWPPGRMSALAGFLEPGESIEESCAREVAEEAGLTVTAVRYHSSQPWPFPSQLMIGLFADVSDDQARPDQTELEAVAWLTRDEARAALDGVHPTVKAPPSIAIARRLIEAWVEAG